jgi:heme exporter protein D
VNNIQLAVKLLGVKTVSTEHVVCVLTLLMKPELVRLEIALLRMDLAAMLHFVKMLYATWIRFVAMLHGTAYVCAKHAMRLSVLILITLMMPVLPVETVLRVTLSRGVMNRLVNR